MRGHGYKLKPSQVRYIRTAIKLRRKLTDKALAARFGVHQNTISNYAKPRPNEPTLRHQGAR